MRFNPLTLFNNCFERCCEGAPLTETDQLTGGLFFVGVLIVIGLVGILMILNITRSGG